MEDNPFPERPSQQNLGAHPELLGLEHMEGKKCQNIQGPVKPSGHNMDETKKNLWDSTFLKVWHDLEFPTTTAKKDIMINWNFV